MKKIELRERGLSIFLCSLMLILSIPTDIYAVEKESEPILSEVISEESSTSPTCTKIEVSGSYKTLYNVGEDLDFTGMIFTAHWTDGTTKTLTLQDITVSGYDKTKEGEQQISLSYGDVKTDLTVTVQPIPVNDEDVKKVIAFIDAIGKVTLRSEAAIDEARAAYIKLSEAEQKNVSNYQTLLDAEKELENLLQAVSNAKDAYKTTGSYFKGLVDKTTPMVSSIGGEWMVIGLARSGYEISAGYFDNVVTYVKENIDENGCLHTAKSTENSRLILALTASGYDPRDVGGYNLLTGLTDMDYVKKQGINGPIWALIALDSYDYAVPESSAKNVVTRTKLIDTILEAQFSDGGWAIAGSSADSDMTGMALQALAPYYSSNDAVKKAVDKALVRLSMMQESNGAYATVGTVTSESISQVIVALTALQIDLNTDTRFIKNGHSVVDALLSFAVDGGGFKHIASGNRDGMASEQGYYALTSYMRMLNGENSLYDMKDVKLKVGTVSGAGKEENKDKTAAEEVEKLISAIGTVTVNSESKITKARSAYKKLTATQKKLVSNYEDLVDAESALKKAKIKYVEDLIDAIGTVSLNSKTKISRARTAYGNLDSELQKKVGNLQLLEKAESDYAALLEKSKTTTTASTSTHKNNTNTKNPVSVQQMSNDTEVFAGAIQQVDEMLEGVKQEVLLQEMLDVILAYEDLTEEEKEVFGKEQHMEVLKERVAELGQTDKKTGISVSGADWNIAIAVDELLDVEQIQTMKTQLNGNDILANLDISLVDVISGEDYEPTGNVSVKIPLELLGDYAAYDGLSVVHYADDGNVEYLNCTVMGDYLIFNTVEFSNYAISGYHGISPIEALLSGAGGATKSEAAANTWIPWAIAGGCSVTLFVAFLYLSRKNREENQMTE